MVEQGRCPIARPTDPSKLCGQPSVPEAPCGACEFHEPQVRDAITEMRDRLRKAISELTQKQERDQRKIEALLAETRIKLAWVEEHTQ